MSLTKFNGKALAVALAVVGVYAVAIPAPATAAPTFQGRCQVNTASVKVSKTEQTTTTGANEPVIDSSIAFVQGGTRPGCVIVALSGEAKADPNTAMFVTAALDNVACDPTPNFFVRSNGTATDYADRAMNYVCSDVAAGAHRARLLFRTGIGGNAVTLGWRTVVVQYFK
jgi:hypothetical protein